MKKLINKKDAAFMLKDQINESMLRVNAAKFGHSIEEIAPQYTNSYYLPDKSQYVPERQVCKANKQAQFLSKLKQNSIANDQMSGKRGSNYFHKASLSLPGGQNISRRARDVFQGSQNISLTKPTTLDMIKSRASVQHDNQSSIFMTQDSLM